MRFFSLFNQRWIKLDKAAQVRQCCSSHVVLCGFCLFWLLKHELEVKHVHRLHHRLACSPQIAGVFWGLACSSVPRTSELNRDTLEGNSSVHLSSQGA